MRYVWLLLLPACASVEPYAEFGLAVQIEEHTDYWLRMERDQQCTRNPQFHGEIGFETKDQWKYSYFHQSWLLCGGPFNSDAEIYQGSIKVSKKFGGQP